MRVLMIGGTGTISTGITNQLLARGDDVTLYNWGQREAEIQAGAATVHGDWTDYAAFEARMAEAGTWDAVIDMVAFVPEDVENFHYNNLFDNTAARTDLGFRYTVPFAEGARRVIERLEATVGFEDCDAHPFYGRILDMWAAVGEV